MAHNFKQEELDKMITTLEKEDFDKMVSKLKALRLVTFWMWPKQYIVAEPNANSVSEPGEKVVLTGPVEDFVDIDDYREELMEFLKRPQQPNEEYFIKSYTCEEKGPDEYFIQILHDGKKRQKLKLQETEEDVPRLQQKLTFTRDSDGKVESIQTEDYAPDGSVKNTSKTVFLKDPVRMEFFMTGKDTSVRWVDENVAWFAENMVVNLMVMLLMRRRVRVHPDVPSTIDGEKACVSEPLDEEIDFDLLWDTLLEGYKGPARKEGRLEVVQPETDGREHVIMHPEPDAAASQRYTVNLSVDKASGDIITMTTIDDELISTNFVKIHNEESLFIEGWTTTGDQRLHGPAEAKLLQVLLDDTLEKSKSGWFF